MDIIPESYDGQGISEQKNCLEFRKVKKVKYFLQLQEV